MAFSASSGSVTLAQVDFGQGVSDAWSAVATFVPKFVAFLLILLVGWLVAKALAKVVDKILDRVGFDRAVERGGIKRMLARSKYDASDLLAKLVYYGLLLVTLQIAFGVWGPNPVSTLLTAIVAWLPSAAVAIIIVVIAGAIARVVKDMLGSALGGLSYGNILATVASVFIWALGIIAALNQIGVATAVTTPVLITVLATVGGVIVVGMGGGLIRPMQQRWDRWLNRAEDEVPAMKAQTEAYRRGREDTMRAEQPTKQQAPVDQSSGEQQAPQYAGAHQSGYGRQPHGEPHAGDYQRGAVPPGPQQPGGYPAGPVPPGTPGYPPPERR